MLPDPWRHTQDLRQAVARHPGDDAAYARLAEHMLNRQYLEIAAKLARRGIGLAPQNPIFGCVLGEALLSSGKPEPAAHIFLGMRTRHPDNERVKAGAIRSQVIHSMAHWARLSGAPPGLAVRGPFRDTSGYSFMVRNFLKNWIDEGEKIILGGKLWGPELDEGQRDPALDALNQPVFSDFVLHFDLPDAVLPVPGLRNINFSMTETSRVTYSWIVRAQWHDRLIVPTQSSLDAWVASGMSPDFIRLCPLGCDVPAEHQDLEPLRLTAASGRPVSSYRTRFINVSSGTTRKNIGGLMRAWARATRTGDDAILILKLGKGDKRDVINQYYREILNINQIQPGEMAEVVLVNEKYSDEEISSLLKSATHYISMSYGEGWDLPMGNAGSLGLSLIAPDHSAYRTYLNPSIAHFLPTRAVAMPELDDPQADWWEPDEDAAVEIIRRIIAGDEPPKQSPQAHLNTHFRWRDASRRLLALCKDDR